MSWRFNPGNPCCTCQIDCTQSRFNRSSYTIAFGVIPTECCQVITWSAFGSPTNPLNYFGVNKDVAAEIWWCAGKKFLLDGSCNAVGADWSYRDNSLTISDFACDSCASSSYTSSAQQPNPCTASYDTAGCGAETWAAGLDIDLSFQCRIENGVLQGRWLLQVFFFDWKISAPTGTSSALVTNATMAYTFDSGWFDDTGQAPFFTTGSVQSTCGLCTDLGLVLAQLRKALTELN